jgi:hypothetical protein
MEHFNKPRLRHCTIIADPDETFVTLVVGRQHFELEQSAGDRPEFFNLKSYFDGRHTIRDISRATDIAEPDVIGVADALAAAGLLQNRHASPTIPVGEFLNVIEDSSIMWRRQIGLHELFAGLEEQLYRKEVFAGLLLETYHYVRLLAPTLLSVAQTWESGPARDIVVHYANEEIDHYRAYENALEQCTRVGGFLKDSHPTVGTLSLIRNFESIGRRSSLSLVCCLQLIEARIAEVDAAEDHLARIANKYQMDDVIRPFLDHMRADVGLEHSSLLQQTLRGVETLPIGAAHEAVNDMHDLKHCFDVFHDSVLKYYGDVSNYIPRPKVDYFAL